MRLTGESVFRRIAQRITTALFRKEKRVGEIIEKALESNFNSQGRRGGFGEWVPTSAIARRKRVSGNYNAPTLVDTGKLRDSMSYEIKKEKGKMLVAGTCESYGFMHNEGYFWQVGDELKYVPARRFMYLTNDDESNIRDITKKTIRTAFKE